jgi:hypothetical protein
MSYSLFFPACFHLKIGRLMIRAPIFPGDRVDFPKCEKIGRLGVKIGRCWRTLFFNLAKKSILGVGFVNSWTCSYKTLWPICQLPPPNLSLCFLLDLEKQRTVFSIAILKHSYMNHSWVMTHPCNIHFYIHLWNEKKRRWWHAIYFIGEKFEWNQIKPCLDVIEFVSIHMCWGESGWNFSSSSTPIHPNTCGLMQIQLHPNKA